VLQCYNPHGYWRLLLIRVLNNRWKSLFSPLFVLSATRVKTAAGDSFNVLIAHQTGSATEAVVC
jgi:hypothetical protein